MGRSPWGGLELLAHPAWSLATLRAGIPRFANVERYAEGLSRRTVGAYITAQIRSRFDWDDLKKLRDRWPRRFVVKGLMTAEDSVRARDLGCDGVVVSNHGGRQLDSLAATIDVLPEVRAAVGPRFPLIIDGGVRSGEHVIKALAAGADFVLVGRAMMYAMGALGPAGAAAAIALLADESSRCLGQIGYADIPALKAAAPLIWRS